MITKRTKLFEEFVNEAVTAEVMTVETKKMKKAIETEIVETLTLTEEIEKLEKELKALKNLRDPKVKAIIEKMEEVKATSVTVEKDAKKIQVKVVTTKGRVTLPYKEISEALAGVNKKMTAMNEELKKTLQKVNADKKELEFKVDESVMSDIKKWLGNMWDKITKSVKEFFGAADNLHKLVEKHVK